MDLRESKEQGQKRLFGPKRKQGTGSDGNAWTYGKARNRVRKDCLDPSESKEQGLRRLFGPKRKQGTGSDGNVWTYGKARTGRTKCIMSFITYSSPNITVIKPRTMKWAEHVTDQKYTRKLGPKSCVETASRKTKI